MSEDVVSVWIAAEKERLRQAVYDVMVDHPVWATVVDGQSDEAEFSRLVDAVWTAAGLKP